MAATEIAFGIILFGLVCAISVVDMRRLVIPDWLNLALLCAGLIWQVIAAQKLPLQALAFAGVMIVCFWLLRSLHGLVRGVVGLGLGDVKMAGAAACWFSPWNAPLFLLAASLTALVFVAAMTLGGKATDLETRVPFGPFIGFGLVLTWLAERSGLPTFIPNGV